MESHRVLLAAGSNAKGQLGTASYDDAHTFTPCQFAGCKPNQLPDPTSTVTQIACGANHTILLLKRLGGSTTLWGTGDGQRGQLGPGYGSEGSDSASRTFFHKLVLPPHYASRGCTFKHIAAAWETTYIVLEHHESSDVLLSMGSNDYGALGIGEGTNGDEPRLVDFGHVFPGEVVSIRSLHAGPRHVVVQLATTARTALVGWGASRHGQLGDHGGARCVARPMPLPIDIHDDPMVSCGLGNQHTVVLHASGRISALGSNKQGQIPSIGHRRLCGLGCTWNGTYMQATDGDKHVLLSTGNNAQGQLGQRHTSKSTPAGEPLDLPDDRAISSFVCGSEHVLVSMRDSPKQGTSVLGWGWNEHGNMGLGSLGNIAIPTQLWPREVEMYNQYPQRVIGIWAGCATSWLLVE